MDGSPTAGPERRSAFANTSNMGGLAVDRPKCGDNLGAALHADTELTADYALVSWLAGCHATPSSTSTVVSAFSKTCSLWYGVC